MSMAPSVVLASEIVGVEDTPQERREEDATGRHDQCNTIIEPVCSVGTSACCCSTATHRTRRTEMSVPNRSTSISRRSFLTRATRAAAGGVAAGMFPDVLRAAPAAFASTARDTAQIRFIGWQYHPEIVSSYVSQFEKLYHKQVHYELVPGDYASVAETKFA